MGRYDKIKVYNNGWKTPSRVRVYRDGWRDLGTATSYSKAPLYTFVNGKSKRVTLNRRDYKVVDDQYIDGAFKALPSNGFCCCSKSSESSGYWFNWHFKGTVYKTSNTDKRLFYCGSGSNYVRVDWLSNGRIKMTVSYSGGSGSITSSNAVQSGNWVYLNCYMNKGSYTATINFNNVKTSGAIYASFRISSATNTVGDSGVYFKNTLSIAGVKYNTSAKSISFNASTASGSDGSRYTGVKHKETSHIVTKYE